MVFAGTDAKTFEIPPESPGSRIIEIIIVLCKPLRTKPQSLVVNMHNNSHILNECLHNLININSVKVDENYAFGENT